MAVPGEKAAGLNGRKVGSETTTQSHATMKLARVASNGGVVAHSSGNWLCTVLSTLEGECVEALQKHGDDNDKGLGSCQRPDGSVIYHSVGVQQREGLLIQKGRPIATAQDSQQPSVTTPATAHNRVKK